MIPEKERIHRSDGDLSIASKAATTFTENGMDDKLLESDNLTDTIDVILGTKPNRATSDRADELIDLLVTIKQGFIKGGEDLRLTLNTIDDAIELAFLYSPFYKSALRFSILSHLGYTAVGTKGLKEALRLSIEDAEKSMAKSDAKEGEP
jgi:hypothetical protein